MVAAEEEDDEVPGKQIYISTYKTKIRYIYLFYVLILKYKMTTSLTLKVYRIVTSLVS